MIEITTETVLLGVPRTPTARPTCACQGSLCQVRQRRILHTKRYRDICVLGQTGTCSSCLPGLCPGIPIFSTEQTYVLNSEIGGCDQKWYRVICQLSDDGMHGLVVSLDRPHSTGQVPQARPARGGGRQPDRRCGEHGSGAVHRRQQQLSWDDFPFKWCRTRAKNCTCHHRRDADHRPPSLAAGARARLYQARTIVQRAPSGCRRHERMLKLVCYFSRPRWTSALLTTHMSIELPYVIEDSEIQQFLVRAMHQF